MQSNSEHLGYKRLKDTKSMKGEKINPFKKIIKHKKWKNIKLATSEKIIFILVFILLFCGAFIESYRIIQLTR